jgi:hypothetical protein
MSQAAPDAPDRLSALTRGEHMLLWAFRASAFGAGRCGMVRRQFEDACGPGGAEAINALMVFVRELALQGRRRISICAPGSHRLSRDEQLVLAVFATAQAEDYQRMEAHLAWLAGSEPSHAFGAIACLIADTFALNGLILRVPDIAPAPLAWPASAAPASDAPASGVVTPFRPRIATG